MTQKQIVSIMVDIMNIFSPKPCSWNIPLFTFLLPAFLLPLCVHVRCLSPWRVSIQFTEVSHWRQTFLSVLLESEKSLEFVPLLFFFPLRLSSLYLHLSYFYYHMSCSRASSTLFVVFSLQLKSHKQDVINTPNSMPIMSAILFLYF